MQVGRNEGGKDGGLTSKDTQRVAGRGTACFDYGDIHVSFGCPFPGSCVNDERKCLSVFALPNHSRPGLPFLSP